MVDPLLEMRSRFDTKIAAIPMKDNGFIFTKELYETLVREVEEAKCKEKNKTRTDRRRLHRFDIVVENNLKKLIYVQK